MPGLVVFAAVAGAFPAAGAPSSASEQAGPVAAEKCRTIVRVVKGKRRRVRVCPKASAKPKNVTVAVDRRHAVTTTVGAAGGTVAASGADGTRYTLAVPAGAVSGDTALTVTPVTKLSGVAKLRLLAGVELGPDGTVLAKAATVTLTLPRSVTGAFGIGWDGAGRNAHRYPLVRNGRRVTMRVAHFSGVAVAQGDASLLPQFETALTIAYAREVRPLLRAASTDDALFTAAVDAGFRWIRATELTGLRDRFKTWRAEADALLRQVFSNALDKATERCRAHDLTQVDRILKISQKAETMQWDLPGLTGFERVRRCARFELDMALDWNATLDYRTTSGSETIHDALTARATRIPLEVAGELANIEGAGSLEPTAWNETVTVTQMDYSCSVVSNGGALPKEPLRATLRFDPAKLSGSAPEIYLTVDPGDVTTPRGGGCGSADNPDPDVYRGAWDALYSAQKGLDGRFVLRMTQYVGGDVFARFGPDRRSGTLPALSMAWSGELALTLRHTPL